MATCPKCSKEFAGPTIGTHAVKCGVDWRDLFWQKVNKIGPGGCWIWTASIKPRNGYGHFRTGDRDYNAHRLAYEMTHGEVAADMEVAHRCDVPACVNPQHLFLATHTENMADCKAKKRHSYGTRAGLNKLTEQQVIEIRSTYRRTMTGSRTVASNAKQLAAHYGVTVGTLTNAALGRTWSHLE